MPRKFNGRRSEAALRARDDRRMGWPVDPLVLPAAVSFQLMVQHYGSGKWVVFDLVPAVALGLGRANQWTVVIDGCRLWRAATGLDEVFKLARAATIRAMGV